MPKQGPNGRTIQRRSLEFLLRLGMKCDGARHYVASLSRMALKT